MLVLAVDIGLRTTGYVVCSVDKVDVKLVTEGEIKPKVKDVLSRRLFLIHKEIAGVIENYKPKVLVLERLYTHYRHPTTVSLLAQVRGAILILAEAYGIDFCEYSPTKARKSFLGKGNVRSYQVKKMAENVLGVKLKSKHTADAFSLAVTFSHVLKEKSLRI